MCVASFVRTEMPIQKESATLSKLNQPDVMPDTSQTPFRSFEVLLADELSDATDLIKWPRAPDLREIERMAGWITAAGFATT